MTLLFGRYTQVTTLEDIGFPEHRFNSAAYNEVGHQADARDSILTGMRQHLIPLNANTTY